MLVQIELDKMALAVPLVTRTPALALNAMSLPVPAMNAPIVFEIMSEAFPKASEPSSPTPMLFPSYFMGANRVNCLSESPYRQRVSTWLSFASFAEGEMTTTPDNGSEYVLSPRGSA